MTTADPTADPIDPIDPVDPVDDPVDPIDPVEDYEGLSAADLIGIIKEKSMTISKTNQEAASRRIKNKKQKA